MGLGHAIHCAKPLIKNEAFAVVLPDMIINSNIKGKNLSFLKQEFEKTSTSQILLGKAVKKDIHKYGVAKN